MNSVVLRLLKGFLARSGWVYAVFGLAAYLTESAFWAFRIDRIPLSGTLLGLWGCMAGFNTRSLVWRSLPIEVHDLAMYRWWTAVGAPGLFLMIITLVSWVVQSSSRLPTPDAAHVLFDVLANWSALSLLAAAWDEIRHPSFRMALMALLAVTFAIYGLPATADGLGISAVFIAPGLALLVLGVVRARHASDMRHVYALSAGRHLKFWRTAPEAESGLYGVKSFYVPMMRYTAILTAASILGFEIAHRLLVRRGHASADTLVLLVAFAGLSASGAHMTNRLRTATQPLRSLPLSTHRLAGLLEIMGVLPGLIAAMLTLLTARFLFELNIDTWIGTGFALTLFGSTGMLGIQQSQNGGVFVQRWQPIIQRLVVPGYLGMMFAQLVQSNYWSSSLGVTMRWIWLPVGILCFGIGHYSLVRYLRTGVRPSANQNSFSVA